MKMQLKRHIAMLCALVMLLTSLPTNVIAEGVDSPTETATQQLAQESTVTDVVDANNSVSTEETTDSCAAPSQEETQEASASADVLDAAIVSDAQSNEQEEQQEQQDAGSVEERQPEMSETAVNLQQDGARLTLPTCLPTSRNSHLCPRS